VGKFTTQSDELTRYYRNAIRLSSIVILDFVNFLTFDESYNDKLVFYSVKLVSITLLLEVCLGHTHTTPRSQNPQLE
jgi:hypothetical protein